MVDFRCIQMHNADLVELSGLINSAVDYYIYMSQLFPLQFLAIQYSAGKKASQDEMKEQTFNILLLLKLSAFNNNLCDVLRQYKPLS